MKKFYMVVAVDGIKHAAQRIGNLNRMEGRHRPSHVHYSYGAAEEEAERQATQHNKNFIVLAAELEVGPPPSAKCTKRAL